MALLKTRLRNIVLFKHTFNEPTAAARSESIQDGRLSRRFFMDSCGNVSFSNLDKGATRLNELNTGK